MNKVILIGRLVKDLELRKTPNDVSVVANTIAVNRKFKNQNGETEADFINFVSFGATAELISKYFKKGDRIGLEGRIQTRSYENQEGNTVYVTEVVVDNIEFLQERKTQQNDYDPYATNPNYNQQKQTQDPFAAVQPQTNLVDDDLPF